jgi:ABC-type phosphate/phosphonate transport system substrate-binding protein
MLTPTRLILGLAALAACGTLHAADSASSSKISFIPSANAAMAPSRSADTSVPRTGDALVFSAPPQESAEDAHRLYQPVAEFLTRALARPVTYVYPRSWLSYQRDLTKGAIDIVFDGAHLTSWGIARLRHNPIARIAEPQVFAVITRQGDTQPGALKQLAGKTVCTTGATSLAALTLLSEFEPARQPLMIEHVDWQKAYTGLIDGRCTAATLPLAALGKLDGSGNVTRVLHQTKALPNQAFSAGPRLTAAEQRTLAQALTAPDAKRALAALLAANGAEQGLTPAVTADYVGMDAYLKDVWGYAR